MDGVDESCLPPEQVAGSFLGSVVPATEAAGCVYSAAACICSPAVGAATAPQGPHTAVLYSSSDAFAATGSMRSLLLRPESESPLPDIRAPGAAHSRRNAQPRGQTAYSPASASPDWGGSSPQGLWTHPVRMQPGPPLRPFPCRHSRCWPAPPACDAIAARRQGEDRQWRSGVDREIASLKETATLLAKVRPALALLPPRPPQRPQNAAARDVGGAGRPRGGGVSRWMRALSSLLAASSSPSPHTQSTVETRRACQRRFQAVEQQVACVAAHGRAAFHYSYIYFPFTRSRESDSQGLASGRRASRFGARCASRPGAARPRHSVRTREVSSLVILLLHPL